MLGGIGGISEHRNRYANVDRCGSDSTGNRVVRLFSERRHAAERREYAPRLDQYLVRAAVSHTLALPHLPRSFDLGDVGRQAERLLARSLAEPGHPEHAAVVWVNRGGGLSISTKPLRGDEHQVRVPGRDRRLVLTVHTHGDVDTPFSAGDLAGVLLTPSSPRARVGELLITPTRKLLVLRTARTPWLSAEEVEDSITMLYLDPAMEAEHALYTAGYEARGGEHVDLPPEITPQYKDQLQGLGNKRMLVLLSAAEKYELALYSCHADTNIVKQAR